MKLSNDEKIYLQAKHQYYIGTPSMTDVEFDALENKLRKLNSEVIELVGYNLDDMMYSHPTPMLSLQKIQVTDSNNLPLKAISKWISETLSENHIIESGPKFDGSSCNMNFEDGKLVLALTRGNGKEGNDITDKLKIFAPVEISYKGKIQVRGEVVIPEILFEEKYSHIYANPRNFVAGKLSTDDIEDCVKDFKFVAFEMKDTNGICLNNSISILKDLGFEVPVTKTFTGTKGFKEVYDFFLDYRKNSSPYQLDGMVLKFEEKERYSIGETSHHPKWAVAIKFPAEEAQTKIINITWNIGKNGDYCPVGVLETVQLAGTKVSHVSLYNYGNVANNKLLPGAEVTIIKSGDIIPKIIRIDKPSDLDPINFRPTHCVNCKSELVIEDIHLVCNNFNCEGKEINRLSYGIKAFGNKRIGGSTILKLHEAGIKTIEDFWNPTKMNKDSLIKSNLFKSGRALDIVFEAKDKIKETDLWFVIYSLCFEDVGASASQQLANYFAEINYDFKGLTKAGINRLINKQSNEYNRLFQFINLLTANGVKVKYPEVVKISADTIKIELTGSPKEFGFNKKEDFLKLVSKFNCVHYKLDKDCNYLVTDDLESSSSKMDKANKLGITILTYDKFIELLTK